MIWCSHDFLCKNLVILTIKIYKCFLNVLLTIGFKTLILTSDT